MNSPVELVTIHHEGGGAPRDFPGGRWPYTYWLGATSFHEIQTPWTSWGTINFNGVSLDVVFSGQRQPGIPNSPAYPVSDNDINIFAAIIENARSQGFVVDDPLVRAHRNSPGSNTACPGDNTMARWSDIVRVCTTVAPPIPTVRKRMLFIFRRPKTGTNTYLGDGFQYRWIRSQAELDTYVVILGIDPGKIATFTDEQVVGMTYVGPQPS